MNSGNKVVELVYDADAAYGGCGYVNIPVATATNNVKIDFKVLPYIAAGTAPGNSRFGLGVGLVYDDGTQGVIAYTPTSNRLFYIAKKAENTEFTLASGTATTLALSAAADTWNDVSVECDLAAGTASITCGTSTSGASTITGLAGKKVVGVKLFNKRNFEGHTKYFDDISITAVNPDRNSIIAAYSSKNKISVIYRDVIKSAEPANFSLASSDAQAIPEITDVNINGKNIILTLDSNLDENAVYTVASGGLSWADGNQAFGNRVTVVPETLTVSAEIAEDRQSAVYTISKNSNSPVDLMIIAADYSEDGTELMDAKVTNISYSAGKNGEFTDTVDLSGYSHPKVYIWTADLVPLTDAAE